MESVFVGIQRQKHYIRLIYLFIFLLPDYFLLYLFIFIFILFVIIIIIFDINFISAIRHRIGRPATIHSQFWRLIFGWWNMVLFCRYHNFKKQIYLPPPFLFIIYYLFSHVGAEREASLMRKRLFMRNRTP